MTQNFLHTILRNFVEKGQKIAFHIDDISYTYEEFSRYVYSYQQNFISESETKIGVFATNTIESYACQMAIWMSGKTFIPLNSKNPVSRNQKVISEAGIKIVYHVSYEIIQEFKDTDLELIDLNTLKVEAGIPSVIEFADQTLAYILFTSGSTGIPKGVQINWQNINSFVESFLAFDFDYAEEERFLQMFDFSFDVSVASTLIPLILGYSVYTVSDAGVKFTEVYSILEEKQITFASIVPSMLSFLKPYFDEIELPQLRNCILTAEASHNELVKSWKKCIPNARIFNFYGPTEATIWSTAFEWTDWTTIKEYNGMPPIGKPLKKVQAFIIENNEIVTEFNKKGELCLGGGHITPGYCNDEEKNKSSFIYINKNRYYKTGDICFYDRDGEIMYCGRSDHQVQLRGYRVELNEIEYPVKMNFKIGNAIALPYEIQEGSTSVYLFVEGFEGGSDEIYSFLKSELPPYMLPEKIIILQKFPTNNSDKVDRKKLSEYLPNKL